MTKAAELAKMGEVLTNSQIGGRRNIIINGAMQVAQRGTSFTPTTSEIYTLDRFKIFPQGSTAGRATITQDSSAPNGFANSLKIDVTTADTSIAASEAYILGYQAEGQDVQMFKKGTSEAEQYTVSFYVKGNASATYVLELFDMDNSRQISKTFNVTTDWARVIMTFPSDTTGSFDNDNASSLALFFHLHAGSTFTSGTINSSAWAANTNANRVGSGTTSIFDSTDRTFFITGLQMEVGSQATPFEHRSFGEELALCQRYCFHHPFQSAGGNTFIAGQLIPSSTTAALGYSIMPVPLRATPTLSFSALSATRVDDTATTSSISLTTSRCTDTTIGYTISGSSFIADTQYFLQGNGSGSFIQFDAELQEMSMNITSAKYIADNGENCSITAMIDNRQLSVPLDPANRHYQAILEWVAEGNKIEDADQHGKH